MNERLDTSYNHRGLEEEIYEWWEKNGYFRPEKQLMQHLQCPLLTFYDLSYSFLGLNSIRTSPTTPQYS